MRHRAWIFGLTGCLLMAGSVYGFLLFMKQAERKMNTMETVMPVRMLQSGETVEAALLRKVVIPSAAHNSEAVTDPQAVVGKAVVVPIAANEEIAEWKLSDRIAVPVGGERYFSFKTDAVANVNNMVRKGDIVDVWVEFDAPKLLRTAANSLWSVGAVKIIEGLPVTGVKTAEGTEVTDAGALEAVVQSNRAQLQAARAKPGGKPELNTYIMNDDIYEAYALGSIGGKIKLALPDLTSAGPQLKAKVTSLFLELKAADAFSKSQAPVHLNGDVKPGEVSGKEVPASGAPPAPAAPGGAKATEVRP